MELPQICDIPSRLFGFLFPKPKCPRHACGRTSRRSPSELTDREAATTWGDACPSAYTNCGRGGRSAHQDSRATRSCILASLACLRLPTHASSASQFPHFVDCSVSRRDLFRTSPSQAPKSRPLANTVPIAATIALEMSGPMPGTVFLPDLAMIEQQDCSMLDWTSVANGALLLRPEAP